MAFFGINRVPAADLLSGQRWTPSSPAETKALILASMRALHEQSGRVPDFIVLSPYHYESVRLAQHDWTNYREELTAWSIFDYESRRFARGRRPSRPRADEAIEKARRLEP